MVTLAPELPGALDVIEQLVGEGVVVSVGHTDADAECVADAERAGATARDPPVQRHGAVRPPGARSDRRDARRRLASSPG